MFAQHGNHEEPDHIKRKREFDRLFTDWDLSHQTIAGKLGIWNRGSQSEALRKEIIGLARDYITTLETLLGSSPPRLTRR